MAASTPRPKASEEKSRPSVFWPLAGIVIPIVGWFAKIEIEGAEHLPREGAYIVAPSHSSEFDPLIVAVAVWRIGRAPRFMAKESLFKVPVLGAALRATGMIPVARSSSATAAKQTIDQAEHLVEHGQGVIVYPEGSLTRDPDLWPMRGKTGVARLALAAGATIPVIPMAHWGTEQIMPRYGKLRFWPPRRRVRVLVGPPIDLSEFSGRANSPSALAQATDVVMAKLSELVGVLRGETPPAERWNPAAHGQKETGRLES